MSGFVELQLRSACSRHPLWKRPRSGKVKLKNGCFLNLYHAYSKNLAFVSTFEIMANTPI